MFSFLPSGLLSLFPLDNYIIAFKRRCTEGNAPQPLKSPWVGSQSREEAYFPSFKALKRRVQGRTRSESNDERGEICPSSTVLPSVHRRYRLLINIKLRVKKIFFLHPLGLLLLCQTVQAPLPVPRCIICFIPLQINKTLKRNRRDDRRNGGFIPLQINKTLKHLPLYEPNDISFIPLQINKTLKRYGYFRYTLVSFIPLQINKTLKRLWFDFCHFYCFIPLQINKTLKRRNYSCFF